MGMIFLSKAIETSKFIVEYLISLILHHFIRLLGFSYQLIPNSDLNVAVYPDVIE